MDVKSIDVQVVAVARRMLVTAAVAAVCLIALGEILPKLLHFSTGALAVTEKVFGFLLAALAVQLVLNGLEDLGLIHQGGH